MKKYITILLIIVMAFSIIGCAKNEEPEENITENTPNESVEEEEQAEDEEKIVDPTPNNEEIDVTLYFANKEYVNTGDESLEKLITEKRTIEYGNISLEEAIVKELMKGPESDELSNSIPSNVTLLGVEVADGTAFVNFSQEGLYGGSMQEDFTIAQIVNSLLELDSVNRVQFLIDGEKAESLMGHFSIMDPFEETFYTE